MKKIGIRTLIIAIWLSLVLLTLYLPKFFSLDPNSLNIFTYGDTFNPSVIDQFEKETGIKVRLNYYSSNEELIVKLKATQGKGYDIVVPSSYAIRILVNEGLLKEIDKSKLGFWDDLQPSLLGKKFDPHNTYSIPLLWEIYALGIDKEYFRSRPFTPSWKMIFDEKQIPYKISMVNDPIEAVELAAFYLFGYVESLTDEQRIEVQNLLMEQKKWVEAYADTRGDYFLATKNCPVVIASSAYIIRSMKKFPFISLAVPEEGTFVTIENIALPKPTEKDEQIYKFLNYLYSDASVKKQFETNAIFPVTKSVIPTLDTSDEVRKFLTSIDAEFLKYHLFSNIITDKQTRDIWIRVKSEEN